MGSDQRRDATTDKSVVKMEDTHKAGEQKQKHDQTRDADTVAEMEQEES
jgi:hypothetical protein